MSYRCEICGRVAPPGQPRLRHVLYREQPRKEIEREMSMCSFCEEELRRGRTLAQLRQEHAPPPPEERHVKDLLGVPVTLGKPSKKVSL